MLEVHDWHGEGFKPLVITQRWQVALLNWEPPFERTAVVELERHNHTDEVFVLVRGRAVLFTRAEGGALEVTEMTTGVLYNVPAGVWHNIVATKDVTFVIVEDNDTDANDTQFRPITSEERAELDAALPEWAFQSA